MSLMAKVVIPLWAAVSAAGQASPAPAANDRDAILAWCRDLSGQLRSVQYERCAARAWRFDASSKGAHPIPYLRWGKTDGGTQTKRVMVVGAIHGDEISSVSMVFRWLDFLERTRLDSFLRRNLYVFVPLANPDGFYARPRTRTNLSGVDINRNFATHAWEDTALAYWKRRTNSDPRRYPGARPGSEVETRVIEKAIGDFKPDMIISVHAPYKLVDHDGPILFPDLQSPLPLRTLGAFPGSLGTYAGVERDIPVVTPELPSAKTMPDVKSIEQLFLFIMKARY